MKIKITMKDPGCLDNLELSPKEIKALSVWIEYGEYIRVEFDTEAGTATVLKVK